MRDTKFGAAVALMASVSTISAAQAQNLIVNGDFETGDLSGWNASINSGTAATRTNPVNSGSYSMVVWDNSGPGTVSQAVNVSAGTYTLSFAIRPQADTSPANSVSVIFDGQTVLTFSGESATAWRTETFTVAVADGTKTLEFDVATCSGCGAFYFDDVSLVLVSPTPSGPIITDAQILAELKLQAAQQGVILTDAQNRAVLTQLRQRMSSVSTDQVSRNATGGTDAATSASVLSFSTSNSGVSRNGRWAMWFDTSADQLEADWNPDVSGFQARQQFGVDYSFDNGWVGGISAGIGTFDNDFANGGSLSGDSYWIAPYLGANVGGWLMTVQAAYTYTDYDSFNTGLGIVDSTSGQRYSASASLSREFALGSGYRITPEAAVSVGQEDISRLAALPFAAVDDPYFFNARMGGELSYDLASGGRVYGQAFAEYTDTNGDGSATYLSTGYEAEEWSATIGGGFDIPVGERGRLGLDGRVRGLGSDTHVYGLSASYSVSF